MFLHPKKARIPPIHSSKEEKSLLQIYKHKSKRPLLKHPPKNVEIPQICNEKFQISLYKQILKNPKLSLTTPPPQKQICAPEKRPLE